MGVSCEAANDKKCVIYLLLHKLILKITTSQNFYILIDHKNDRYIDILLISR